MTEPPERVNHQRQRTLKLAPMLQWERRDVFLLVRFEDGGELWYALRDLLLIKARYEVVGFARRIPPSAEGKK